MVLQSLYTWQDFPEGFVFVGELICKSFNNGTLASDSLCYHLLTSYHLLLRSEELVICAIKAHYIYCSFWAVSSFYVKKFL